MAAINPTENTGLIVDEFIRYAQSHLTTVMGTINTTSLYPGVPATPGPGVIIWTGYTVEPATPSQQFTEDDFPKTEETEQQFSTRMEEEEQIPIGVEEVEIDIVLDDIANEPFRVSNTEDAYTIGTFNQGKPFVSGFRGGGGFSPGFSGAINVDLGALNLGAEWTALAAQFIGKKEGFTAKATWDVNAYRLGFGSDKILGADGTTRKVQVGDTTTTDAALKMLQYEVAGPYKNRLVGNGATQIPQATFDALNNKQKAALLSYVYNCGSLRVGIANAVKSGNLSSAAAQIKEGPITGGGKVYPGLVKRRAEEAALFLT